MKKTKPKSSPEDIVADTSDATSRLARELGVDETVFAPTGGTALARHVPTITAKATVAAIESIEEHIDRIVEERVRRILEEEKVLVSFCGKAKPYRKDGIEISKFDPRPEELEVIEERSEAEPSKFLEELKNLR